MEWVDVMGFHGFHADSDLRKRVSYTSVKMDFQVLIHKIY